MSEIYYRWLNFWRRKNKPDIPVNQPVAPAAPTNLSSTSITNTSMTLTWTPSVSAGVTAQRIYLNNTLHTTIANGTSNSQNITGLTPGTSYTWKMTAYNATNGLNSGFSNIHTATTTQTVVTQAPNPPANFTAVKTPGSPSTSINLTWTAPAVDATHSAHTGYKVYADGTQVNGTLAASATSYTITGQTPGDTVSVTMKATNATGDSASTSAINVTLDAAAAVTMMMGCSDSNNDNGGTEDWDGWRCYTSGARDTLANRTGANRPLFLAYSENGENLGGANPNYNTIYNHVLDELNQFYYNGTGNTQSARWGIKLFWSNGNENSDKGCLRESDVPLQADRIARYNISQQALYDAVHYAPGGVRRFPDAYAGSNPTQNHEQNGIVEYWLHPSARYHDFVMWSMYPPGRQTTAEDPTYNFPSFVESQRTNLQNGFLIRCFYRTFQAQAAARAATGNSNFRISIGCGEVGTGDSPENQNTRPYYAVHALAGAMHILAQQYGLEMPFACWWDNEKAEAGAPQNILSDEPAGTSPTTRQAWQNWRSYDHRRGGVHPGTWAGLPGSITKFTGTKV